MRKMRQLAVTMTMLTALFGTSAFADSRPQSETQQWRGDRRGDRRVTMEGRVAQFHRSGDGYRVRLDRDQNTWFHVPHSVLRSHNRDFRVGVFVRFGGVYDSRGYVYVSSADWLDERYGRDDRSRRGRDRDREFLRGTVERVDFRNGAVVVRDEFTRDRVTVVMAAGSRRNNRGIDLHDLRRGDYVELIGDWERRGVFEVSRINSVRSGRW